MSKRYLGIENEKKFIYIKSLRRYEVYKMILHDINSLDLNIYAYPNISKQVDIKMKRFFILSSANQNYTNMHSKYAPVRN